MAGAPSPLNTRFDLKINFTGHETLLKVKPTTKLSKVFNAYAEVRGTCCSVTTGFPVSTISVIVYTYY
eukprot:20109-Heterococcus_DN1.PRE.3